MLHDRTVVVVPLTTGQTYPFRIPTCVDGKEGVAAIDQVRAVDKQRLVTRLGKLDSPTAELLLDALAEMFAP